MTELDPDKRKPMRRYESIGGPANFRDASQTVQALWTKPPTVIQTPATDGQAQRKPFRGNENPYYRSGNNLDPHRYRAPGNPNVRQTVLAKPPNGSSLSADFRPPKRQKFDNNASSSLTSNSASSRNARGSAYRNTFDLDIQEIEPPRSTNNRNNTVRNVTEVIDLQTSSDDLAERISPTARRSSPDPLTLGPSKPVSSKSIHAFQTLPTEYSITTPSKGKARADESHIVVEGSEEDEDIEDFTPSRDTELLYNARNSMAIPKNIVQDLKTHYESCSAPAPAAIRHPIKKGLNSVDLVTGRIVGRMKNKEGVARPKSTGTFDSIGTSSSNFVDSTREKEKTQVLPLMAWCLGHHLFRHSEAAPAKLRFESTEQRIKVSWGQPPEHIEFKIKEYIRSAMIVNDSEEALKNNVVVQFTTRRTDNWHETELKYTGFKGGAERGKENLTFLFSTSKDRGYTITNYQQFVTAVKKMFAGPVVQIIGKVEGGAVWEVATRRAEMFEQTTSGRDRVDLNESIVDGPSMPIRSTTPCSLTRTSHPEPPKESYRRSARQSAIGSSKASPPAYTEPDEVILMYPPTGIGALSVMQSDLRRLQPEEYLNDTLIEFGLKLWLNELRDKDPVLADQIHVFSSFFYKKLHNKKNPGDGYKSVRKWTSKVPFFDKKYVIVPINENLHWYLAIIYEPGHTLEPPLQICQPSNARKTRRQKQQQERSEADAGPATVSESMEVSPERSSPTAGEPDADVSSADATRMTTPSATGNEEMNDTFDKACSITAESRSSFAASSEFQVRDPSPLPDLLLPPSDGMDVDVEISDNSKVPIRTHKGSDEQERSTSKSSSGIPVSQFYACIPESDAAKPIVTVDNDDSVEDRQQEAEVDNMLAVPQSSRGHLPQTYIFTLDSLGTRHPQAIKVLRDYLAAEAKDKRGFDEVRVAVGKQVQVPVQPNTWDCGIYLLHFVNVFMRAPSAFLEQILSAKGTVPSSERKKLWQDHEIAQFRDNLRSRIMQLSKEWKAEKVREEEANKRRGADALEVEALSSEGEVDIVEDVPIIKATPGPRQKKHATRLRG